MLHQVRAGVPLPEPAGVPHPGAAALRQPPHQVLPHRHHAAVLCKQQPR